MFYMGTSSHFFFYFYYADLRFANHISFLILSIYTLKELALQLRQPKILFS